MNKIGILGGTFNPVHNGHLNLALQALKVLKLDKIIFIPTFLPPHKNIGLKNLAKERLEMCSLLVEGYDFFEVSDIELNRGDISYTIDTLTELKKIYKTEELFLIVGSDVFLSFLKWKDYNKIFNLCTICVMSRNKDDTETIKAFAEKLKFMGAKIKFIIGQKIDISSTLIREKMKKNEDMECFLPKKISEYIYKNNLYK